jgi:hypothetical protein
LIDALKSFSPNFSIRSKHFLNWFTRNEMNTKENNQLTGMPSTRGLVIFACLYCAAALIHFTHNAEYLADYPNMPKWITRGGVYFVWAAETLIGVGGAFLLWRGYARVGTLLLMIYAALGFDGLLHYSLAPMAAHSFMMNFTILFEVATGVLVISAGAMYLHRARRFQRTVARTSF